MIFIYSGEKYHARNETDKEVCNVLDTRPGLPSGPKENIRISTHKLLFTLSQMISRSRSSKVWKYTNMVMKEWTDKRGRDRRQNYLHPYKTTWNLGHRPHQGFTSAQKRNVGIRLLVGQSVIPTMSQAWTLKKVTQGYNIVVDGWAGAYNTTPLLETHLNTRYYTIQLAYHG